MTWLNTVKDSISTAASCLFTSSRVTYWWGIVTSAFSILSVQDYFFILGTIFGAVMTWRTYRANIREKRENRLEEQKRTAEYQKQTEIIKTFLEDQGRRNLSDVEAVSAVGNAVRKADNYTSPDAPVGVRK